MYLKDQIVHKEHQIRYLQEDLGRCGWFDKKKKLNIQKKIDGLRLDKIRLMGKLCNGMTFEEFDKKYRRNYINYAALVDVAYVGTTDMEEDYSLLSDEDIKKVVGVAKEYAKNA